MEVEWASGEHQKNVAVKRAIAKRENGDKRSRTAAAVH